MDTNETMQTKEELQKQIKSLKIELHHETHSKEVARRSVNQIYKKLQEKENEINHKTMDRIHPLSKRMNDINTFYAQGNEVYINGKDENGKTFYISFDSYNFLNWIDLESIKQVKKTLIKYIKENE